MGRLISCKMSLQFLAGLRLEVLARIPPEISAELPSQIPSGILAITHKNQTCNFHLNIIFRHLKFI